MQDQTQQDERAGRSFSPPNRPAFFVGAGKQDHRKSSERITLAQEKWAHFTQRSTGARRWPVYEGRVQTLLFALRAQDMIPVGTDQLDDLRRNRVVCRLRDRATGDRARCSTFGTCFAGTRAGEGLPKKVYRNGPESKRTYNLQLEARIGQSDHRVHRC